MLNRFVGTAMERVRELRTEDQSLLPGDDDLYFYSGGGDVGEGADILKK